MNDPQLTDDLSFIESLSKLFAVALGLLYLLGFLVVASYLSRYGVSSFSVLHLQYLIAGFWVLGPLVIHASVVYASHKFDEGAAPYRKEKTNWRRFAISSLFTAIPISFFVALLVSIPNVFESMTWGIGIRFMLFYAAIVNFAGLFWTSRHAGTNKETWWMNRSNAAPFYLAFLLMILLGHTVWFSVRIYSLIPFSLGGGGPLTVVFIEVEKKMPDEIEKTDRSAKRSIPYKLLLSTERTTSSCRRPPKNGLWRSAETLLPEW